MTKKALGLAEFNKLPLPLRLELLHRDGVHVGKKKSGSQQTILFQLYSFYVEVHYKEYRKKIDYMVTSDNTDILLPYIDQVQVRDLKNGIDKE